MGFLERQIKDAINETLDDKEIQKRLNDYVEEIIEEQAKRALRKYLMEGSRLAKKPR